MRRTLPLLSLATLATVATASSGSAQQATVARDGILVDAATASPPPARGAAIAPQATGASSRASVTIDFEFFPGPDGLLGTPDDIPITAPTLFSSQLEQLTDQFASLGIEFTPLVPIDDRNEILDAASFTTPPSHTPPNLLGSAGSEIIEFRFTVAVSSVTALIGISGGSDVMEIYDSGGASLGARVGDDVEVTLSSTSPIARVEIRPFASTTPAIDNLIFESSGLTLSTVDSCPGPMTFNISGATPHGPIAVIRGPGMGTSTVSTPCGIVTLGLAAPTLVAVLSADGSGNASLTATIPPVVCGSLCGQVLDLTSCALSNVLCL